METYVNIVTDDHCVLNVSSRMNESDLLDVMNCIGIDENHIFEIIEKVSQTRNSLESSKRSSEIHKSADYILQQIKEIVFVSVGTQTDFPVHTLNRLFSCFK